MWMRIAQRSCTLNIDNVGLKNIKKIDGTTDPGGTFVAGQPQWVFYDGTVFRLMGGAGGAASVVDSRGDVRARRFIASMDSMPYQAAMTLDVTAGDVHKIRTAPNGGNARLNAATAACQASTCGSSSRTTISVRRPSPSAQIC